MAEDCSLSNYASEAVNRWQPLWKPKDPQPETKARVVAGAPAPAGSCEFMGNTAFVGCHLNCDCARLIGVVALLFVTLIPKFGAIAGLD